jgi:hypothetical protein
MLKEHERAVLTIDLPDYGLKIGDVGTIVHIYSDEMAYEIEFFTLDGHRLDVVTVEISQVRPIKRNDVLHVREMVAG